jgi:hypothetical protein
MLLLGVALATLFHELAAPEVADEHQVVISYIKNKAPRVWCVDLRLGVKTGYPRRASFEVDDSAIMDFIFVYPGWSFLSHKRKSTYRAIPRRCYKLGHELRRTL